MKKFSPLGKVKKTTRVSQLLILVSFLITFIVSRLTVKIGAALEIPSPNVIRGVHVHHLVPGIFLLLISGYLGISYWRSQKIRWLMAVLFGIGAGLTIDEFALWLNLRDVYWEKEGRMSVDAIILIAVFFLILFFLSERRDHYFFKKFWRRVFVREKRV